MSRSGIATAAFQARFAEGMKERGWNAADLVRVLGARNVATNPEYITALLYDPSVSVSLYMLTQFAAVLQVTPEWLAGSDRAPRKDDQDADTAGVWIDLREIPPEVAHQIRGLVRATRDAWRAR